MVNTDGIKFEESSFEEALKKQRIKANFFLWIVIRRGVDLVK